MKRIAVVTGASSGMGKEFVRQLIESRLGLDEIWLIARRKEILCKIVEEYPNQNFRLLPLDLEKEESWMIYQEELEKSHPAIRILINAAGYGMIGNTDEIDVADQTGMIRLNCEALEAVTQISIPYLKRGSRIIQVASASAFLPQPGFNVYAASKAFVVSYSRALGRELRKREIYITAVCPGPVQTEFFDRAEKINHSPDYKKAFRASKEKVVAKALKDSKRKKSVSVYGFSMNMMRIGAKLIPHELLLKGYR
ncbi:MAG: SDR family NAD(P)-dependent oxidoreductase [Lachnospiraceae bacterium]|nr:SDR family NAD(P)-dependent oxidoreductase [Lachnospiraceae bacterium]